MSATTKSPNLKQIAQEMRAILDGPGAAWVHRRLSRGLEIVLQREERQYRLALGRLDTWPSLAEIIVCRQAFAVPHGTEPKRIEKKRPSRVSPGFAHDLTVYVVELLWQEEPHP